MELHWISSVNSKCNRFRRHTARQYASLRPQKNTLQLDPNDIFIQGDQGKADVFGQAVDAFLLETLADALNKIPPSRKKLKDMTQSKQNSYISDANFNIQAKHKTKVPKE